MAPVLIHADWGTDPKKRWHSVALPEADGYQIDEPTPAGNSCTYIPRLLDRYRDRPLFLGFDFPIGLPRAYCDAAGISSFRVALESLGFGEWDEFYEPANSPDEIGLHRPFYPMRSGPKGKTKRAHLLDGLGLASNDLLRRCERPVGDRKAAEALFWTLGSKQVGKAAIAGWREVLQPTILADRVSFGVWPFEGNLLDLLNEKQVVVAETYPAEACAHLGFGLPGSNWAKSRQDGRRKKSAEILQHAEEQGLQMTDGLVKAIRDGFGSDKHGDDRFDALVGLLSMIEVVEGRIDGEAPDTPDVRTLEGWILGRPHS